jgi:hypothetical protein
MDKTVVGLFSNLAQDKSSPVLIQNEIENNSGHLVHISVKKSAYSLFPRNALTYQTGKGSFIKDICFKNLTCKNMYPFSFTPPHQLTVAKPRNRMRCVPLNSIIPLGNAQLNTLLCELPSITESLLLFLIFTK